MHASTETHHVLPIKPIQSLTLLEVSSDYIGVPVRSFDWEIYYSFYSHINLTRNKIWSKHGNFLLTSTGKNHFEIIT